MSDIRHDDLSGSVVGSYRITGQLTVGGMGAVFRAQHELLGKPAAVKVLRPELCTNAEIVERFFMEARAATQIRHPGIVEVFDFGYHADGRAFLVMELLDGESLSARMERTGFSEVQAAVIARGIASALGAAHAKGIIHRDLKPDNIMLVPDPDMPAGERPKVLDFGIAKLSEYDNRQLSKTRTGALMGTPAYMAPEQARAAGEIDPRADLYSLGCILYEMLTGAPPFVAEGAGEVISLHLFAEPERPSARRAGVGEELERITLRLLAKEPDHRFANAAELVDALSAAIPTLSGRMSAVLPVTNRRKALVVPTHSDAGIQIPAVTDAINARPMPTTPMPIGAGAVRGPAPRRDRGLRPAIIAGTITLGLTAAVVVFLVLREPAGDKPVAPPPAPPTTVDNHVVVADPGPPPAQAADISYFLDVTPIDATITVDGTAVVLEHGFFTLPSRRDRRLIVVSAPGYQDASAEVPGDHNEHRTIALVPVGQVAGEPTRTPKRPGDQRGNKHGGTGVQSSPGGNPVDTTVRPSSTAGSGTAPVNPDDAKTRKTATGDRMYIDLDDDPPPPKHDSP